MEEKLNLRRADLPPDFFAMVPRAAIRDVFFPEGVPQNAIWDFCRTRAGRFFVSLCGEGGVSVSASLYELLPEKARFRHCFDLQKVCLVSPRAIPPSKIHSSIDELPDGRLILLTHTTAPAPGHPFWLPDAYYSHGWEGFAGSNLLIFDPVAGDVRNLGVPVPRESLYGGIYDPKHNAYYMIGFLRGHLYRHDLSEGRVDDMGQVSEFASFRLTRGPDGHIYGSTRSGWLFKVDVDRRTVVDLQYQLPGPAGLLSRKQFAFAATGPDGRLYIAHHCSDRLVALDTGTGQAEEVGSVDPIHMERNFPRCVGGMCWDDHGRLWYGLASHVGGGPGFWTHLACWDLLRGAKPEILGLIGTAERATYYVSEMLHVNSRLYLADTNHGPDAPGIRIVDLSLLKAGQDETREQCCDPHAYAYFTDRIECAPFANAEARMRRYVEANALGDAAGRFAQRNPFVIRAERVEVVRLWREIAAEQSAVRTLAWTDEDTLAGLCGATEMRRFRIRNGRLLDLAGVTAVPGVPTAPEWMCRLGLPARQGRQFLAVPACWAEWSHGRWLVGTRDGMLAVVDPRGHGVRALGAVAPHGPVRAIAVNADKTAAYGTAGDASDLGHCFYYSEQCGICELGRAFTSETDPWGVANSCVLDALALSPSGRKLALGAADRLGTIYVYHAPCLPDRLGGTNE